MKRNSNPPITRAAPIRIGHIIVSSARVLAKPDASLIVPVSPYDDAFKAMFTSRRKGLAAVAVDLLGETDGTPFVRVKRLEEISGR
jgi:hypothetical protein